jgi:hypothetical protein
VSRSSRFSPASIATEFDVVITGAGISFDSPSSLPGAPELAGEVWKALRDSIPSSVDGELNEKVSWRLRDVRMEQFLELITKRGTIPARIVVDAYRLVGGAAFNENHRRLAALKEALHAEHGPTH